MFSREPFFCLFTWDRIVWEKYLRLWTPFDPGLNLDPTVTLACGYEPPPPHL